MKSLESTVVRAIQLIEAFDKLEGKQDWEDVPSSVYRRILGERYIYARVLEVCWDRYKRGTLHTEVLDLYDNLPPAAQARSEIKDGIARIRKESDSRSEKSATRGNARGRRKSASR